MRMDWLKNEEGATSLEYALIISFVFLACVTVFHAYADKVGLMYETITTAIDGAM